MKKLFYLIFGVSLVFMAACGEENSSEEDSSTENESISESYEEDYEEVEAEAEVTDIKYYNWTDNAIDEETITVYAEIKNTTDTEIDVGLVDITFLDSEGGVIAVNEAPASPSFLNEGGTGYVSAEIEDEIEDFEDLDEIKIEVSPVAFQEAEIIEFTTKDQNLKLGTWGEDNTQVNVTGFFKNDSDIDFTKDDTYAVLGLYDKDGNFIGVETMYSDQEFSIDANGETSFDIGGGPLPPEIGGKVDYAEVKAIGIENMEDYGW